MVLEDTRQLYQHLKSVSDPIAFLVGFFANSPVGFAIWKADGHLLLTNQAFRSLFGSEPPPEYSILQDDVADPGVVDIIRRAFEGEIAHVPTFWYDPRELKHVTVTEGKRVAVSMTVFPVFDHNSDIEYVAAAYEDDTEITLAQEVLKDESEHLKQVVHQMEEEAAERIRAQEELRRSQQHFQALIQNAADVIQLVNTEGIITYVSASVTHILGYVPDEMIGRTPPELLHPDELPYLERIFYALLEEPNASRTVEQRIRHRDGTWHWAEVTATNLMDNPAVQAVVVNYHDISERKQAEDALRASQEAAVAFQERLRTLHTLSVELAQAHTLDELHRKSVELGCKALGFDRLGLFLVSDDPNKAVGTYGVDTDGQLQDEHGNWFLLDQTGQSWKTDRTRWNIIVKENVPLWHNRQVAGVGWNALAILGHESNPVGWLAADNLIHQRPLQDEDTELLSLYSAMLGALILKKQAEDETLKLNEELEIRVRKRTAELEASNKELDSFSYSVSHDLRAPLRSIDGFSQALLEDHADKLDNEGQDYLNRVRAASQRMGKLTDDMLMLARVTRREMNPKEVNLSAIAQSIAEELGKTHPEREVEFVIAPDLEANVDASLIGIVLEHLLGNAWKYTSKQPRARIEFGAIKRDNQTVFFVRDDGAGFDMAYAGKLFAPFQRLHKPDEFEGTGIGLATVQRIVMKHGGRVWAEGAVNQGATFYFTFDT